MVWFVGTNISVFVTTTVLITSRQLCTGQVFNIVRCSTVFLFKVISGIKILNSHKLSSQYILHIEGNPHQKNADNVSSRSSECELLLLVLHAYRCTFQIKNKQLNTLCLFVPFYFHRVIPELNFKFNFFSQLCNTRIVQ